MAIADDLDYKLHESNQLLTPCLLVYPSRIRSNLQEMIRIAGNVDRLRPHVKTHKTAEIVRIELEFGITKHKCATLSEAKMLAECEVPDVLLAYQPVGPAITRLGEFVSQYPKTKFTAIIEDQFSARQLSQHFTAINLNIDVLVDLDTGMHRTGIVPGPAAAELYKFIDQLPGLRIAGLHVYDGQNHQPDLRERQAAVQELMQPVNELLHNLVRDGLSVPKLVCGGTPTFPVYAGLGSLSTHTAIECSPGTCVLSDFNSGKDYADMSSIQHAAVLMTRVISTQQAGHLTVDLGNKAVASDPPAGHRCHFLEIPDAVEKKHNEEHLVIETEAASKFQVGDVLYALPAHICPTVALHSHLQVVEAGQVVDPWRVTARDRLY